MHNNKRRLIEGWIDKASNQLRAAKEHLKSPLQYSESIEASQECVELSIKSILLLLDIKFSQSHGWAQDKKQFADIARQIQERQLFDKLAAAYVDQIIPLPRLLFLVNFWAHFYITAKYGLEVGYLASAKDIFKKEEADLAVLHAEECLRAVRHLAHEAANRLAALLYVDAIERREERGN